MWIGKTGKLNIKKRVSEFNVDNIKIQLALQVKNIIREYDIKDVRAVSTGSATFFAWVRHIQLYISKGEVHTGVRIAVFEYGLSIHFGT